MGAAKAAEPLDRDRRLEIYYFLRLNRTMEDRLSALYRQGKVQGGLYSSRGQEATSVGSAYALQTGDILAPMIRNLGSLLVRGVRPQELLRQYLQREGSPSRGRDTGLHFGTVDRGLVGPISHLGTLIPVMTGVALAARMQGTRRVALAYIGDGATSTGDFHEGLALASIRRVPLVLIVENNLRQLLRAQAELNLELAQLHEQGLFLRGERRGLALERAHALARLPGYLRDVLGERRARALSRRRLTP